MGNISKLTPILYDKGETNFNHNGLGKLTKLLANEVDEVLNGEFEAFFEYPANGHLADKIDNEMFIKAKPNKKDEPHIFKVYDYELDTFTQTYLIYARSKNIEDLRNNVILDVNVRNLAPTQAWNLAKNNALDPVVTTFYSDITTTSSVHWERRSLLSTIAGEEGSMIQYWSGEIKHGIDRISLFRRRGQDNVTTVRHGKNLDGLKATYSTKGLVTAIVPYYVKGDDKAVYGEVVESQYIKKYPSTYYDIIEYNDEELGLKREDEPENGYSNSTIKTALNKVAKRYFDENISKDLPSVNMEIALEDISQTKEYEQFKDFEQIEIGDTITVYSKKFNVNINAKVRRVVYNGLTDKNELVEVGTARRSLYDDVRDDFKKVETELQEGIDNALVSANGKNTNYYGTADPNEIGLVGQNNDNYFRTNGQLKELWIYRDGMWHLEVSDLTGEQIRAEVEQAQQEIADTKENIDNRLENLDIELTGKFTDIDEELLTIEEISNKAEENAQIAISHGLDALEKAGQIEGDVSNISFEVDRIGGQLDLKADRATVDEISEVVDMHALDIKANAEGLALKANKDTVDRLEGTVSSLGTDVDVVAGQISNKVWNTDIESAVDGLEYENRNLLPAFTNKSWLVINADEITDYEIMSNPHRNFLASLHLKNLKKGIYTITFNTENARFYFYDFTGNIQGDILAMSNSSNTESLIHTFELEKDHSDILFRISNWSQVQNQKRYVWNLKLEKGTKATDWSPAPEDTDAKINHIETEFTQTFESFDQRVVSLDGRVTLQSQEIGRITQTIQDVSENVGGNTTKINQTINTVDSHSQTIATIETDLDGKVEVSEYNTLVNTVDSTIRRIGDAEGNITQIEASINGLQTTVAGKASLTQFSQLETGFKLFAGSINTVNKNLADRWFYQRINDDGSYTQVNTSKAIPYTKLPDNTTHLTVEDGSWGGWYNSAFFWYKESSVSGYLGKYDLRINEDLGENIVTVEIPPNAKYFRYHTTPNMSRETKIEVGTEATGLFYNDSEIRSEISVVQDNINLKVEKGDVVGQINIEAGTTLIENDKLYLDARTVVFSGKAFIPGAVIKDLSADKLTAGIIDGNHIRVINLDAGHIVTGTLTGVRVEAVEGYIGGWTMEKGGLYKDTPYGYTVLKPDGDVAIATSSPQHSHAGGAVFQLYHNGRMSFLNDEGRYSYIRADNGGGSSVAKGLIISSQGYIYMSPGATVEVEGRITPDVNKERTLGSEEKFWSSVFGYTFRINNGGAVQQGAAASDGGNSLEVYSRGSLMLKSENRAIYSQGGLYPYYSSNTYYLGSAGYRWQGAFLSSQPNVSSDMRDKKLIQDIPQGLIEQMKNVKGKWYQQDGKWHLGYIAQDVERAIYKYVSSMKKWDSMEAMNEYARSFAMLHKDESKLSLLYGEIAVIKEAEMQARMDRLENKLEELLNAS